MGKKYHTATEMKAAKLMWIKGLQNKMVSEENFEIKTADLGVYCDENGLI